MPWLQINLWALFWIINKPSVDNVADFLKRIQQTIPHLKNWWQYSNLEEVWPLLNLAVEQQNIEKNAAVHGLISFLGADTQMSIAKQVADSIQEFIKRANTIEKKQFSIAVQGQVGLGKLLPQLVSRANQIGITVEELVGIHTRIFIYRHSGVQQIECDIAQFYELLIAAEESIKEDGKWIKLPWWYLVKSKWLSEPKVMRQGERLLELLLEQRAASLESPPASIVIALFLKLLTHNVQIQRIAPRLFETLPLTELLTLNNSLDTFEVIEGLIHRVSICAEIISAP